MKSNFEFLILNYELWNFSAERRLKTNYLFNFDLG